VVSEFEFNQDRRDRAKLVVGATSYSLILRNCEHTVTYIHSGIWSSAQTLADGLILNALKNTLVNNTQQKMGTFPKELEKPFTIGKHPLYDHLNRIFKFESISHTYTADENDLNVVILGPTGTGKSFLINVIANQEVVESKASAVSVTSSLALVRGQFFLTNETRSGIIVDTIGLCDTKITLISVQEVIKKALLSKFHHINLLVFVLPKRITGEMNTSINHMLSWLNYHNGNRKLQFLFLINATGTDSDTENAQLIASHAQLFHLKLEENGHQLIHCIDTKYSVKSRIESLGVMKSHFNIAAKQKNIQMKEICGKIKESVFSW